MLQTGGGSGSRGAQEMPFSPRRCWAGQEKQSLPAEPGRRFQEPQQSRLLQAAEEMPPGAGQVPAPSRGGRPPRPQRAAVTSPGGITRQRGDPAAAAMSTCPAWDVATRPRPRAGPSKPPTTRREVGEPQGHGWTQALPPPLGLSVSKTPFSPTIPFQSHPRGCHGLYCWKGTPVTTLSPSPPPPPPQPARPRRDLTNFLRQELLSERL